MSRRTRSNWSSCFGRPPLRSQESENVVDRKNSTSQCFPHCRRRQMMLRSCCTSGLPNKTPAIIMVFLVTLRLYFARTCLAAFATNNSFSVLSPLLPVVSPHDGSRRHVSHVTRGSGRCEVLNTMRLHAHGTGDGSSISKPNEMHEERARD